MLTQDQQNTFRKEGLIRLPGLLPVEYVSASADRLLAICKKSKLDWHIDVKRLSGMKLAGVQLFAFLESVKPGGGGPVAVTGSHRIETRENVPREIIRSQLRDHAFFADVLDHAPEARADLVGKRSKLDGVELAVVELTGEPGDVYLMDLWILHTRWPNYSDSSRMMLTQRFLLKEAYERVGTLIG